jgi:hypothetical protein
MAGWHPANLCAPGNRSHCKGTHVLGVGLWDPLSPLWRLLSSFRASRKPDDARDRYLTQPDDYAWHGGALEWLNSAQDNCTTRKVTCRMRMAQQVCHRVWRAS